MYKQYLLLCSEKFPSFGIFTNASAANYWATPPDCWRGGVIVGDFQMLVLRSKAFPAWLGLCSSISFAVGLLFDYQFGALYWRV
jgi:hypothetical protein